MEVGIAGAGGMVEHSSGANFLEANHIAFANWRSANNTSREQAWDPHVDPTRMAR
jgi:hypothetical protein